MHTRSLILPHTLFLSLSLSLAVSPLDFDIVGRDVVYMLAQFVVFSGVVIYLENNETFLEKVAVYNNNIIIVVAAIACVRTHVTISCLF